MNARIFALVLVAIGTALALGGSAGGGMLLVLLGMLWGFASFIPSSSVESNLEDLARDELIVTQAFCKCLEEFFPEQCFSFESFEAIDVERSIDSIGEFHCEFREDDVSRALGAVTLQISEAGQSHITVHAITGDGDIVVDYNILDVQRYWERCADKEINEDDVLIELNE